MGRTLRISIGIAILILAGTAFLVAVYHIVHTGNCRSGGSVVSTRECPDKTGWLVGAIFASIIGTMLGTGVLDKAWEQRDPPPPPITGLIVGGFFLLLGGFGVALATGVLEREAGPGWGATAYIVAGLFVPAGLLALLGAVRDPTAGTARGLTAGTLGARVRTGSGARSSRPPPSAAAGSEAAGSEAAPAPGGEAATEPPAAPQDRLDRLEKLAQLRAQGVLTESEFAVEKAKILAGL